MNWVELFNSEIKIAVQIIRRNSSSVVALRRQRSEFGVDVFPPLYGARTL